jgi:TonB family protein
MLKIESETLGRKPSSNPAMTEKPVYVEHPLLTLERLEWQDERARLRMREAFWASATVHLIFLLFLFLLLPKIMARQNAEAVLLRTPEQALHDQELTYLEAPKAPVQKPELRTDILSDQDRRAASKAPELNRRELERILNSSTRPGAPGAPTQQPSPQQQAMQQSAAGQQPGQQSPQGVQQNPSQQARLESLPTLQGSGQGAFSGGGSAGSAIQQATRAAAASRGGGNLGDFGSTPSPQPTNNRQDFEVLSDTLGWDYAPYLARIKRPITLNWYNAMPESVFPPLLKKGAVVLQFTIMRDGSVSGLQMVRSSGDVALDRAAWAGITASNPFPQLPTEFRGDSFTIRARFSYNPDRPDVR